YTPWPRLHRELSLEMMRFGLKGHIGRIANMLNWRLDVMILSVLAPVEVVGYYAVATKVAEAFRPLSAAFTFVLRPMIASLSVSEARAQGVSLYRRVFALNLLLVVIMAFAGGPIIVRMFGPDFVAAVPAFQILLVGLAALGGAGVLNGYNVGIGRPASAAPPARSATRAATASTSSDRPSRSTSRAGRSRPTACAGSPPTPTPPAGTWRASASPPRSWRGRCAPPSSRAGLGSARRWPGRPGRTRSRTSSTRRAPAGRSS